MDQECDPLGVCGVHAASPQPPTTTPGQGSFPSTWGDPCREMRLCLGASETSEGLNQAAP